MMPAGSAQDIGTLDIRDERTYFPGHRARREPIQEGRHVRSFENTEARGPGQMK